MGHITDNDVLRLIRQSGGSVSAAELAEELRVSKSAVNSALYHMENKLVKKSGFTPPYWTAIPMEELVEGYLSEEPITAEEIADYVGETEEEVMAALYKMNGIKARHDNSETPNWYLMEEGNTPLQILKHYFGYHNFRPLQEDIINSVLNHNDSLVLMPTGGGKSICFQVPALVMEGTAIVVSPLIALMKDQVESLLANGVSAAALNSSNSEADNFLIKERVRQGEIKLLYVSPERLMLELNWLKANVRLSLFAIDEAHCVSQWGHDFRPEYTQLGALHDVFPDVPIMALTATADKTTQTDILDKLKLHHPNVFKTSFNRSNLSIDVRSHYSADEKMKAILQIIRRHPGESGIIYCLSRKETETLARKLLNRGVAAKPYHAGLTTEERNSVQDEFINDKIDIVVATIAFGMGIDKSNVRFVIHNNLPKSLESYYQEIGRSGRDGEPSETVLFYDTKDLIKLRRFVDESGQREINLEKLNRIQEFAESNICRRRVLLNYFGENTEEDCCNCDVCKNPRTTFDATIYVQKALSAILRTREQVSMTELVDVLRGNKNWNVTNKGFDKIKTFGVGRETSAADWHNYILQMLQMGLFEICYLENNRLVLTDYGHEVISSNRTIELVGKTESSPLPTLPPILDETMTPMTTGEDALLTAEDKELFDALKKCRSEVAKEKGMPAYIIMSDKTLRDLAQKKPTTEVQFGRTFGIGLYKRAEYAEQFLKIIADFVNKKSPSNDVPTTEKLTVDVGLPATPSMWSREEDTQLLVMHIKSIPMKEMMLRLEKTERAIKSRLQELLDSVAYTPPQAEHSTVETDEKPLATYMDQQKSLHANAYARWTKEDERTLMRMHLEGATVDELMVHFQRNRGSITSRINKLFGNEEL